MRMFLMFSLMITCWTVKLATMTTTPSASNESGNETVKPIVYSPYGKVFVADDNIVVPIEYYSRLLVRLIVETIIQGLELVKISQLVNMNEYSSCNTSNVYVPDEVRFQLHEMYLFYKHNRESNQVNPFLFFDSILNEPVASHSDNQLINDILQRFPNENNEYDLLEVLKSNSTKTIPHDAFEPGLINYNGYNNQTYDVQKIKAEMKKDSFWCFKYRELIFSRANWELALLKFLKNSKLIGKVHHAFSRLQTKSGMGPLTKCFLRMFKIEEKFTEFRNKSKLGRKAIFLVNYPQVVLLEKNPRTGFFKYEVEIPVFDKTLVYDTFTVLKVSKNESAKHEIIGINNRSRYLHTTNINLFQLKCVKVTDYNVDYICPRTFQASFNDDIMCLSEFWQISKGFSDCKINFRQLLKNKKCSEMCTLSNQSVKCSLVCDFWPIHLPLQSDIIHFNSD